MSLNEENKDISKYKSIYEICKDAYMEERERRGKLDAKSQIFLVIIGFEITVMGFVYNELKAVIDKWNSLSSIIIFLVLFSCAGILIGLIFLARSLLIRDFQTYPKLEVIIDEFKDKNEVVILKSIANHFKKIESFNVKENEKKVSSLKIGSVTVIITAFFIIGTFALILYWHICNIIF